MSKWYSQRRFPGAECMHVDGLQSLDQWKSAFNNPSGGKVLHMKPTLHSEMLNMSNLSAWSTECESGAYSILRRVGKIIRFHRELERCCLIRSCPTSLMDSVDALPYFSVP
jgi:hypothetical protein